MYIQKLLKENQLRFLVLPDLSYTNRLIVVIAALALFPTFATLTQENWNDQNARTVYIIATIILIITIHAFLWVKSIDLTIKDGFNANAKWVLVDESTYTNMKLIKQKMLKWDLNPLDFSNKLGVLCFFGIPLIPVFIAGVTGNNYLTYISLISILLFCPQFFSGMLSPEFRNNLFFKIRWIDSLVKKASIELTGCKIGYYLQLSGKEHKTPYDVKIRINVDNLPKEFLGLFGQISINTVSNSAYPYFYMVLIAKEGFNLKTKIKQIDVQDSDLLEFSGENGVEIAVLRQRTTKYDGYYTSIKDMKRILSTGIALTQSIKRA